MDGLLIVDKPVGPTSHDIVARVRRALRESRVGHTGTLDPMASGVLALVLGRATRLARFLSADDKSYDAEIRLGVATDTYDAQGVESAPPHAGAMPAVADIERVLDAFRGTFMQQPPPYSAKKIGGTRSYALARRAPATGSGAITAAAPASVTAREIAVLGVDHERVRLRVSCSAGFYVRSLAHDLGLRLGTGAHLSSLRRTRSGDFVIEGALPVDAVERDPAAALDAIIPLASMLPGLGAAILTEQGEHHVAHGRDVGPDEVQERHGGTGPAMRAEIRLLDRQGQLVGIAEEATRAGLLHPSVVLM